MSCTSIAIRWREAFIAPTWAFAAPAILKGFLDRIIMPGVAFDMSHRAHVRPLLVNVRKLAGVDHLWPPALHGTLCRRSAAQDRHPLFALGHQPAGVL
jgi:hypothetical protein